LSGGPIQVHEVKGCLQKKRKQPTWTGEQRKKFLKLWGKANSSLGKKVALNSCSGLGKKVVLNICRACVN